MAWDVVFYADDEGRQPARAFLKKLPPAKRAAMIAAIELVLGENGPAVCKSEYGKALGQGLYEFRVRHSEQTIRRKTGEAPAGSGRDEVLLRMFFAVFGGRLVLLLGGYDKGVDPSARKQSREIQEARKRLRSFKLKQDREKSARQRRD